MPLKFPRDLRETFYRTTAPYLLADCKSRSDHQTAFVYRPRDWYEPKGRDFACVCLTCGNIAPVEESGEGFDEQRHETNVLVPKSFRDPQSSKKLVPRPNAKSHPDEPTLSNNITKLTRADRNQQDVGNWLTRYGVNDREFAEDLLENVINDPRTYYENLLSNQLNSDITFQEFVVALKGINLSDYY